MLHSSLGFSVQATEYILQRSYKTVIPWEVRSMFSLGHGLSEPRLIKIFVLAFLEGVMQRTNYDMPPKIRIYLISYKGVERLLCSRLTTYNYYGKIFNLNFSIFSLWKSVFLGRGLHLVKLRVYNCPWPVWYSQWRWQVNIVTFEIKERKQAKKKR